LAQLQVNLDELHIFLLKFIEFPKNVKMVHLRSYIPCLFYLE